MKLEQFGRENPEEYARIVTALRTKPHKFKPDPALPVDIQVFVQLRALSAILDHKQRMRGKYVHFHKRRRARKHSLRLSTLEQPRPLTAARKVRLATTSKLKELRKEWENKSK